MSLDAINWKKETEMNEKKAEKKERKQISQPIVMTVEFFSFQNISVFHFVYISIEYENM